jgi:SAM-dependent methyltransferase
MRIGILVVAHNASETLAGVLERIPAGFRSRVSDVLVFDDNSDDATYLVGLGYQRMSADLPLSVIRSADRGYGATQKAGYRWSIERGLDAVVLLHGDGHFAPSSLPDVLAPIERGEADAVIGSRLLEPGDDRHAGMPVHRYLGNRLLSKLQNGLIGTELSEWHCGFRAYRVEALAELPFERSSNGFDFDTQLLVQFLEAGKRVVEVPVPGYSGDELRNARGITYARDVLVHSARYRLHRMGFGGGELAFASPDYELKVGESTSHGRVLAWVAQQPPGRVLDLGCADGELAARFRELGHRVTGVDVVERRGVRARVDEFFVADLEHGIPPAVGAGFDLVVAADVLEHVREPGRLLADARARLRPDGRLIVSVPNFAHWYPRLRVVSGTFDYDRRGILDRGHLRFFTHRTFERLIDEAGCSVVRRSAVGVPLERTSTGEDTDPTAAMRALGRADALAIAARPNLFAFQFVYELSPRPDAPPVTARRRPEASDGQPRPGLATSG